MQAKQAAIRLIVTLVAATLTSSVATDAVASPATQSVAFQQNATHDGFIADAAIATPLQEQWSITLHERISNPLIVNGTVYVTTVNLSTGETTLHARDQATGAARWSRTESTRVMSPAYDRGQIFVQHLDNILTAFDAATGATNWSRQLPDQSSSGVAPTAKDGIVYVAGSSVGGTLYAVRERDGQLLWTRSVANGDSSSRASRTGTTTAGARAAVARRRWLPQEGSLPAGPLRTPSTPPRPARSSARWMPRRCPRSPRTWRT